MERRKRWTEKSLKVAVKSSSSIRQVLQKIGLIEAGGNYEQVKKYIRLSKLDTSHFTGKGWNKGLRVERRPVISTKDLLVRESSFQSFKLKKRLFKEGLKTQKCEICGWAKRAKDGRLPLELDHKNGDRRDNRLENLQILCPNCHSLQPTHRGRNIKRKPG